MKQKSMYDIMSLRHLAPSDFVQGSDSPQTNYESVLLSSLSGL